MQENLIIATVTNFSFVHNGSVFSCQNESRLNTFWCVTVEKYFYIHTKNMAFCVKNLGGILQLYKNAYDLSYINDVTIAIRDCIVSNTHKHVHTENVTRS